MVEVGPCGLQGGGGIVGALFGNVLLSSQGLLPSPSDLGVLESRLGRCHLGPRGGNLLRSGTRQEARQNLLLGGYRRLVSVYGILKARWIQLRQQLSPSNAIAFLHQQLLHPPAVIEGRLYLADIDVAVDGQGMGIGGRAVGPPVGQTGANQ